MNESTPYVPAGQPDDARQSETRELERSLTALRPSAGPIDRDRLMFLAGRAAAERETAEQGCADLGMAAGIAGLGLAGHVLPERGGLFSQWLWPSATAVATVAASVLGLLLAISHRPLIVHEKVYVHEEPTTPTMPRNPGQPEFSVAPPGAAFAGGMAAPGTALPHGMPGSLPGDSVEIPVMSRQEGDLARVDFAPRSSLPPSSYVQNRQVALSLGVEALGSWTPSGTTSRGTASSGTPFSGTPFSGKEHPVAYRERLDGMVSGAQSP